MSRRVLITGCSTGIGRALAQACLAAGDEVIATARRLESLEDLKAQGAHVFALDVNDAASQKALCQSLKDHGINGLDVLIHNAGMSAMGPMLELPADKLRQQFETNVIAPVLLSQALFPWLQASDRACVVLIGSVSGILTTPFAGAYCASKAALHCVAEAMRMELAPWNIHVLTVQPGAIASQFGANAEAGVKDWLTQDSLYAGARQGILARAMASQQNSTPAADFAADLLKTLQREAWPSQVRIGKGSRALPLMAAFLPESLRRKILSRRFSLDQLRPAD